MTVSPEDFALSPLTGTWKLDGSTLQLTYDSGRMETYQYYTSDAGGPEENWPAYLYGEWRAVGVLGNTYTD